MNLVLPPNLKPFGPAQDGTDLTARKLTPSPHGVAGRYSKPAKTEHEKLVEKTRTWVSQTFFGTLLKQMRDSPFKSEIFSGGQGGQAFGQLYDQHLSEHMARGAGKKLVDGIVRRIEANAAYKKQGGQKQLIMQPRELTHEHDRHPKRALKNNVATTPRA